MEELSNDMLDWVHGGSQPAAPAAGPGPSSAGPAATPPVLAISVPVAQWTAVFD